MANLAFAETKVFVEEYTYRAGEADSKLSSRVIAFEQIKRLLLEKLGTYLESETEVKNFQLTKDQIVILTSGIVTAEIVDEKWDGKTYYLKAKIAADPKDVASSVDKLRQDRQKTKELEETRKKAEAALREVERLKKELEIAKAEKPNLGPFNVVVNRLSAIDWFEKGYAFLIAGRNKEAMEAYTRAIKLDPKYALAYFNRGLTYARLEDNRQAIKDLDRAIELDPKLALAYITRGLTYSLLGDNRQAIKNFDRVIELNPKDAKAYSKRGFAYSLLGDYRQAIKDFDKAIELNPKDAEAYSDCGDAYGFLRDYRQRDEDFKSAARLGDKGSQDYLRSKGISW
jgi:tetratricopeptide (TPR) repeat protein